MVVFAEVPALLHALAWAWLCNSQHQALAATWASSAFLSTLGCLARPRLQAVIHKSPALGAQVGQGLAPQAAAP